jgi:hypothetical protein
MRTTGSSSNAVLHIAAGRAASATAAAAASADILLLP